MSGPPANVRATGVSLSTSDDAHAVVSVDRLELLTLAGSLEGSSEHALAKGVVKEAKKQNLPLRKVENFELLSGRGLKGAIGRSVYFMSSARIARRRRGYELSGDMKTRANAAEEDGHTLVFVAEEGKGLLGAISLADHFKESAPGGRGRFARGGTEHSFAVGRQSSGSKRSAKQCGLQQSEIHALMRPENKVDFTYELRAQGKRVAVVGDGINDAPGVTAADVGFALGTGLDIAVECGQIVLVSTDVRGVTRAIRLARRGARTIYWNLFWAFAFNLVTIPLAFFNQLNPTLAAVAMALSSVCVVLNSLRLIYVNLDEAAGAPPASTRRGPNRRGCRCWRGRREVKRFTAEAQRTQSTRGEQE